MLVVQGCKEDPYYARPESLEPVIYKQLEERGNFKSYLACVDRANYKDVLNKTGYFTVFAPTDEAFAAFLSEHNYGSVEAIDLETVKKIVNFSIVYSAYTKERLDDYQSSDSSTWREDMAFKRRTAYYKWVYLDTVDGQPMYVVDMNAVGEEDDPAGTYQSNDYNNKHIPYFTENYFSYKNLSAYDYNYFYPETEFTGFNVVNAQVVESDNLAENGVFHIVDKVILPLPSLDDLIGSKPEYSEFKRLIDRYLVEYNLGSTELHDLYEKATGTRPNIYVKEYPDLLFAPGCENFLRYGLGEDYDAQIDGWTLFVPTNDAIQDFYDTKFLEFYGSVDAMPTQIIAEFINAHFFRTSVWPSKFDVTTNPFGEPARFNAESDVVDKKIASNGIFYGVSKVQETNSFYTLLGDIYLNPDYSMMLQALYTTNMYTIVKNTNLSFTIFMIPNSVFEEFGFTYDDVLSIWSLNNDFLGTVASTALNRIVNMNIVVNQKFEDFSGTGYIQTYGGEFIRYANGQIWGTGNIHNGETLFPKEKKTRSNGISYVLSNFLYYSIENIGKDIEQHDPYSKFYKYLEKSASGLSGYLYNLSTKEITNLSSADPYTILVPCDTAIDAAVRDGYLPAIGSVAFTEAEQEKVAKFIWFHCLKGSIIVPEIAATGTVKTLYKTVDGETYVRCDNTSGDILFFDDYGNIAKVVDPENTQYSKLGNNAVIHLVDNYLRY